VVRLAEYFLDELNRAEGETKRFGADAQQHLRSYRWPGNVRELKNAVERGVIMSRSDKLGLADLMPRHLKNAAEMPATLTIPVGSSMADAKRQLVLRTFASVDGDADRAAKQLGMDTGDVRRVLLALLEGPGARAPSDNGLANRRTPVASVAAAEPAGKAKPAKKK